MLSVRQMDTASRADARTFLRFPFDLYQGDRLWIPPLLMDARIQLNREKHPYYEHS
jgi:hypothetical protein